MSTRALKPGNIRKNVFPGRAISSKEPVTFLVGPPQTFPDTWIGSPQGLGQSLPRRVVHQAQALEDRSIRVEVKQGDQRRNLGCS